MKLSKLSVATVATTALCAITLKGFEAIQPASADSISDCYEVASESVAFADEDLPEESRTEIWCYRTLSDRPGARLVYNVGRDGRSRPELSAIVDSDGTITHASLAAGRISVHRVNANWNPTGIPLDPPSEARKVPEPINLQIASPADGAHAMIKLLTNEEDILRGDTYVARVMEGEFSGRASYLPWRSFWFGHASGKMHRGEDSPMAKYDRFVGRRIGENPGAQQWESRRHAPRDIKWAGHCNGWTAASILRAEPAHPITDPFTGTIFNVSDQKALWMESDWCPKDVTFGHRNWAADSLDGDISAKDFHNAISYYIGVLKKPIGMDLMANAVVENRVVSAFDMNVRSTGPNRYFVRTTLTIHAYDKKPNEEVGPAGIFKRTYSYSLVTDESGLVIKGRWHSRYPDFLWVPISSGVCEGRNPRIDEAMLNEIYRMSLRDPAKPTVPTLGMLPGPELPEAEDTRPPGSAPKVDATPPPAGSQPDEPGGDE